MKNLITVQFKGLTLMEVIISMSISTIVVYFTFLCFGILLKEFNVIKSKGADSYSIQKLHVALTNDLFSCDSTFQQKDKISFISRKKVVNYYLNEKWVIRSQDQLVDTFMYNISNYQFQTDDHLNSNEKHINRLSFIVSNERDTFIFEFSKNYEANKLLNRLKEND